MHETYFCPRILDAAARITKREDQLRQTRDIHVGVALRLTVGLSNVVNSYKHVV